MNMLHRIFRAFRRVPRYVWLVLILIGMWQGMRAQKRWQEQAALDVLREHARIEQRRSYLVPFAGLLSSANQERFLPRKYIIEGIHFHDQRECPTKYLKGVKLDSVQVIAISRSTISPGDLDVLQDYPSLKELRFRNCSLKSAPIRSLRNVPGLSKLSFENCRIAKEDTILVSELPQLQIVRFLFSPCDDSLLNALCDSPQLQQISLEWSLMSTNDMETRFTESALKRMIVSGGTYR